MAEQVRGNHRSKSFGGKAAPNAFLEGRLLVAAVLLLGLVAACAPEGGIAEIARPTSGIDQSSRAVRLETTGCSPASGRSGSGIAIGSGLVVTAAHLIARAETVTVSGDGLGESDVVVAAVDLQRDIAVLRWLAVDIPDVETGSVSAGARGRIVGAAASGTVPFEVRRYVDLTIEEILGTERHSRLGYELAARTADGDSGAGAYDEANRLIGMVFASGPDEKTTWLTASTEIFDLIATVGPADEYELCR